LAFVNNILSAEFFIKMVTIDVFFMPVRERLLLDQEEWQSREGIPRLE
jgi:hypothetical protein